MMLNKIVTPLISIQNTPKGGKPVTTSNLNMLTSLLVQEAATEIHVSPYNEKEKELLITELDALPQFFKNRVKIADDDFKILEQVKKYLEPTYEIAGLKKEGNVDYSDPYLESAIRLMAIACKKNAEVDIPEFSSILNRLSWNKNNCENSEGKARLDNLFGLFNCYSTSSNAGFTVNPTEYKTMKISDRLDDLLAESDLQELSKTKREFGIPASLKKVSELKTTLLHKTKKLFQNPKFSKILSHAPQMTSLALTEGTFSVPAIPILEWEKYNPPIIELTEIRKKILKEIPDLGSFVFLMADSPLSSTPRFGNLGSPTMMIPGSFKIQGGGVTIDLHKLMNQNKDNPTQ